MFDALRKAPRLLITAHLEPVQGERFQPTGFADLGAAQYTLPDGTSMVLVETAQSMANRLEATCVAADKVHLVKELEGLPYVVVKLSGASSAETSSLVEAHRLNSPFIFKAPGFQETFSRMSGYEKGSAINWQKVAETLFRVDPNSLLHGVFMANFEDGRIKIPRAVSAFIDAKDVREVRSGGVKNNPIDPSGKIRAVDFPKNVYSNVPYHRTEYVAADICCYFSIDLGLLSGFGLPEDAQDLLISLALYKITKFLNGSMRLRTACDLQLKKDGLKIERPEGFSLPSESALLEHVQSAIQACTKKKLFAAPPVTQLTVATKVSKKEDNTDDAGADSAPQG
jgi:CRISPR-associated protein Csb1